MMVVVVLTLFSLWASPLLAVAGATSLKATASSPPLNSIVGVDLDFAYVTIGPFDFASNPVRVRVVP